MWGAATRQPVPGAATRHALRGAAPAPALAALDEVDDHRNPLQTEALAQSILKVVGVVPRDPRTRVDLDREPGRTLARLGHEQQPEPVAAWPAAGGRLASRGCLGEEAVELGGRDAPATAVSERHSL